MLALSGSLRAASTNTALLEAARRLSPPTMVIERFDGVGGLPLYTPDLDGIGDALPWPVRDLRDRVGRCDGLLIASPEYAHGVPGAFKNALDWLVSGPEFPGKPIAVFRATPRGHHAHESLTETLRTMSGVIVSEAAATVPLLGTSLSAEDIAANRDWCAEIRSALDRFAEKLAQAGAGRPIPI